MIIIRFQGGLGNQLFQFALYERFKELGIEVKADISDYCNGREKRSFELEKLGIKLEVASKAELHYFYANNSNIYDRIARYLWGANKYIKEKNDIFQPEILKLKEGYLSGYWQSEKYFSDIKERIRNTICFKGVNTERISLQVDKMKAEESVSIHVRMGDYLSQESVYGNICTREYYRRAVSYILENTNNPIFYIFSDEVDKAIQMLGINNYQLIVDNRGSESYKDMYIMSQCKHHIIANSTFSWWGAWLDDNGDKIVIAPPKWNQLCKANEICVEDWIII